MEKGIRRRFVYALLLVAALLLGTPSMTRASAAETIENRANIVFVLDASNSMNLTDADGLRYQAIERFVGLLTEEGNYLGGVVFSNHVRDIDGLDLHLVNGSEEKARLITALKSWTSTSVTSTTGYTNIGEALSAAVDMISEKGSLDLPSYIVFLSDGNTEMPTEEELQESKKKKADAVVAAAERRIKIYSVCLNANNRADTDEMSAISGDSGEFEEITNANDLFGVYDTFVELITESDIFSPSGPEVFPDTGELSTAIPVPAVGVEEVNIIIEGRAESTLLTDPNNAEVDYQRFIETNSDTYKQIKIPAKYLKPGEWTLKTTGVPGDNIQIKMHYSSNLVVDAAVEPSSLAVETGSPFTVSAVLRSGGTTATSSSDYAGYSAEAVLLDAYGAELDRIPMQVDNGRFAASFTPAAGDYYVKVHVTAEYSFSRESDNVGPITVSAAPPPPALPPVPVETPIQKVVYILPFRDTSLTIDLKQLATDPAGDTLRYSVSNSTFRSGTDYTVDSSERLTLHNFSLSKGVITVRATNTKGLSCDIEVKVTCYFVTTMVMIAVGVIVLIVLACAAITLFILLKKPFHGNITVKSYLNGRGGEPPKGKTIRPRRGRCRLTAFRLHPLGGNLDYRKCYFQATGDKRVILITNAPVLYKREKTTKVTIESGVEVELRLQEGDSRLLTVRFDSLMKPRRNRARKRPPAAKQIKRN